jgi:protein involved in polysaccharide export with SLBB domain
VAAVAEPVAGANPNVGGTTPPSLDPNVYRLGGGDVVHIDVFNEPELTLDAGIDGMGQINYPLLGHIPAAGMTVRELEVRLAEQLRQGYLVNPSVRVSMKRFRPIFVMGMVRRVGSHAYSPGLTVEKALAMAGGITEYGSTKKIYVQHPGTTEKDREKVNLDYTLRPGDTIVVEERLF